MRAGDAILAVNRTAMQVDGKNDGSPVTEADLAADRIIGDGPGAARARTSPRCPRSAPSWRTPPYRDSFFLIDPLDGTKEFVAGRDEFTVNLALVTDGRAAARHRRRAGARADLARDRRPRRRAADARRRRSAAGRADPYPPLPAARRALDRGGQPLAWRPRTEAFIAARPGAVRTELGSAVKFGRVAEGARRHLSPAVADLRMGRRGRPCGRDRGRRQDDRRQGRRAAFRRAADPDFIVPEFIAWGDPGGG